MPRIPDAFAVDARFVPLNPGASVYIFANVQEARSIIELLPIEELKDRHAKQMLDRTNFVIAGLYPPESEKRFQMAAWGNYPSSRAGMAFGVDRGWKRQRSAAGGSFWYSSVNRLSIAMSSRQAFIAASANTSAADPLAAAPGVEVPHSFNSWRNSNQLPFAFWLENPVSVIAGLFNSAGIPLRFPVQQFFIGFKHADSDNKQLQGLIRFQFEQPSHARAMAAILNLASGFLSDPIAALFLANPPVQDGQAIYITTDPLSDAELLNLLSIIDF
jgi:uncharacterized protein YfiM (DUF2279 family)